LALADARQPHQDGVCGGQRRRPGHRHMSRLAEGGGGNAI